MYCKLALGNVRKCFKDYAVYFLTLMFGVCVFYAFNSITQQSTVLDLSNTQNRLLELLSMLITGVSVFIAVILGFLVVYANRFLIRRRKREFGIYLTLGMDRSKVSRVIVLETLFVGLLSLVVGLALGVVVSQAMLYVTAALFDATIDTFVITFSPAACIMTVACFIVIFVVALVFNVVTVSRYKLIDLINADRMSESVKLRNLPLSVVLFVISLALIGVAYALLLENGLVMLDEKFAASTALMLVGTFLFFFSLSGFLLRVVQSNKKLYLRGLNAFTLRQLNSKVNTAFLSITLVCVALFLAITSTCGGFAICTTLNNNLANATPYDVSFTAYYAASVEDVQGTRNESDAQAAADGYDMHAALARDVPEYEQLVRDDAQVDYYISSVVMDDLMSKVDYTFNSMFDSYEMADTPLPVVKLSQFNELRALAGLDAIELGANEYAIWSNLDEIKGFYDAFISQGETIELNGRTLSPHCGNIDDVVSETATLAMNTGALVVSDDMVPSDAHTWYSILNANYNGGRGEVEGQFNAAMDAVYGKECLSYGEAPGWPFTRSMTAVFACDQAAGLSTVIAYLAIYIGFVLLIACAAILALQQLSEAADNRARYAMLEKLGAEQRMVNKALFVQIGIYFLFPLALAIVHSTVALSVVTDVVKLFGMLDIATPLAITVAFALVIYGGYFLLTYFGARSIILTKGSRAE